jgi:hypothetical protein
MFGREAVVDREHDVSGGAREIATEGVALREPALHIPAAMEVQHQRRRPRCVGRVDARRKRRSRAGNGHILDPRQRDRLAGHRGRPELAKAAANLHNRQLPLLRARMRELGVNELPECRVECHRRASDG